MSHTNSTANFGLPQFITTDKPAWLTDVNVAYAAIDTAMKNNQTAAASAQGDATQALSDASGADTKATTADSKASGAVASIADTFSSTDTYNVGDLVMYNYLLYRCIVDVSVPGAWTGSANWTRETIENKIDGLTGSVINYKQGESQSIASAVDLINGVTELTITNYHASVTNHDCHAFLVGNNLVIIKFSVTTNADISAWTTLFDIEDCPAFSSDADQIACVGDNDNNRNTYIGAFYSTDRAIVRAPNGWKANVTYRGQILIPIYHT